MIPYLKSNDYFKYILKSAGRKRVSSILVLFLMSISMIMSTVNIEGSAHEFSKKRVLFLSSYTQDFPTLEGQYEGLRDALSIHEYQIDIEYMDSKRFYTKEHLDRFHESLMYKLENLASYDLVIAGDDNALQYVMDHQDVFSEIPVVFLAINDVNRARRAYEMGNITGVIETTSIKETIDLAVDLYPDANELVLVVDQTPTGRGELEQILEYQSHYEFLEFRMIDLTTITFDEFSMELSRLEEDSLFMYVSAYYDKDKEVMSFYESLDFISYYISVPVFVLYDFGIDEGFFGGKVVDYYQQGHSAGEIVKDVLDGKNPSDIKLIDDTSVNRIKVNYEVLVEYELGLDKLPEDTVFVNRPESFVEKYQNMIIITLTVFMVLLLIIIVLIFNIQRRRISERKLQESNEELTAMYEQMLAMNEELETSEEELRESYEDLRYKNHVIEESEERYKYIFELSYSGLWDRDLRDNKLFIMREWYYEILEGSGLESFEQLTDNELLDTFYGHLDAKQVLQLKRYEDELRRGEIASYTMVMQCCAQNKEKPRFIRESARAIYDDNGRLYRIIGAHTDITDEKLYEEKLEELAYKDQLTKMPNRLILDRLLLEYINESESEIVSGVVILIDVDNFKFINNTYGHEVGDDLLKEIANRLSKMVVDGQILGRISGDEFVIVCRRLHKKKDIDALAKRILMLFDERFKLRERSIYITVSIGIAVFPENGSDLDTLLNRANSAIHQAKIRGKNRYEYYDITMNETMENKIYIQNNIREAINREVFMLYYQPLYDINNQRIVGFEALIRWKDELRGFISPIDFIVVAEKMGLINRLGKWIMKEALQFSKYLSSQYADEYYVSINVSSVQLIQQDFVDDLLDIVQETGVEYNNFCIEITETALMQSFEKNAAKLEMLRNLGVKISLDDFGTGYSSLSYLRRLPADILKIDKSFIDELTNNTNSRDLTEGIIVLAQKLGMYVLAEGIEKVDQLDYLKRYGCDGAQGYLISRPLAEDDVRKFIDDFEVL